MKGFYKPPIRKEAGFTALVNNALMVCKFYYDLTGSTDILIDCPQLCKIFDFQLQNDVSEYQFDVNLERHRQFDLGILKEPCHPHKPLIEEELKKINQIFNLFFRFLNFEKYQNEFAKFIDDNTLCVHIRGTDKISEVLPPTITNIYSHIDYYLKNYNLKTIFIATDDIFYRTKLIERYGEIVKFRDTIISRNGNPIHFVDDRDLLNFQVMVDCYLLSNGKYFLFCLSNVSYLSLIMGINNHISKNCLNYEPNY